MPELLTTYIVILSFILLIGIILYYISGRKSRKNPFYSKAETFWEVLHPDAVQKTAFTVFLIGDAGAPSLIHQEPTLALLQSQLELCGENSMIFFLGDNIYPKGLPEPTHPKYAIAEKRLLEQLEILKKFKGKIVFISGNHDWNKGRKGGYDAMMRQQKYLDAYFENETNYLPRNGCPGPVELNINEFLTIVVINTQWWVHGGKKPIGAEQGCSVDMNMNFFFCLKKFWNGIKAKN
jgi:calcineurin-like phosphoesterase family protein